MEYSAPYIYNTHAPLSMERHWIAQQFAESVRGEKESAWASCERAYEASGTAGWLTWAVDLANAASLDSAETVKGRAHAFEMYSFCFWVDKEIAERVKEKGYSYFKEIYGYWQKGVDPGALLDMADQIDGIKALRAELYNAFADGAQVERRKSLHLSRLVKFYEESETLGMPQNLRHLTRVLIERIRRYMERE